MTFQIAAACAAVGVVLGVAMTPAAAENMVTPVLNTAIEGMPNTEANVVLFDVDPRLEDRSPYPSRSIVRLHHGGRVTLGGRWPGTS